MSDADDVTIAIEGGGGEDPSARRFGHFRIVRALGRGGQGQVYEALDERLHRRIALKVLTVNGLDLGEPAQRMLRARFEREAEAAARLDHPNVCAVHDFGETDGMLWIAMQLVEGETLQELIARSREARDSNVEARAVTLGSAPTEVTPAGSSATDRDRSGTRSSSGGTPSSSSREARSSSAGTSLADIEGTLRLIETVARALHEAHERGLVHRDVKPANIMVTPQGRPVVLDFGLAADASAQSLALTQSGDRLGTPAYMAPEQIAGNARELDRRTDVHALGVTLFECLTLRRPFEGSTREALFHEIIQKPAPRASRLNSRVSPDLEAVLDCALDKDPDRRYATAAALADDLAAVRESRPTTARRLGPLGRTLRWARRNRVAAALIVVLVTGTPLLAGLGGYLWARLPDLRAQEAAEREERAERHLEEGFAEAFHGSGEASIDQFQRVLALVPDSVEARAGLVYALLDAQRPKDALAVLDAARTLSAAGALEQLRVKVLAALGQVEEARQLEARLPEPRTALDWFIRGSEELRLGHRVPKSAAQEHWNRAEAALLRAVAASPHARRAYLRTLADAVGHVKEHPDPSYVADALRDLWPEEASKRWSVAHALSARPDAEAVEAWRHYLEVHPDDGRAWYNLACVISDAIRAGRLDAAAEADAEVALRRAIRLEPTASEPSINLASTLRARGAHEEALTLLDGVLEREPGRREALTTKAAILDDTDRSEEAVAILEEVLAKHPDAELALDYLATCASKLGRHERALEAARRLRAVAPRNVAGPRREGVALLALGRNAAVVDATLEHLVHFPNDPELMLTLGMARINLGDPERAEAVLREAQRIAPANQEIRVHLAVAASRLGREEEAARLLRELLAEDPGCLPAWEWLLDLRSSRDAHPEAVRIFEEARAAGVESVRLIADAAPSLAAVGREPEAYALLEAAVQKEGRTRPAFEELAEFQLARRRAADTLATCEKARAKGMRSPRLESLTGLALGRLGRPREALEHHEAAARLDPDDHRHHWRIADLARPLGLVDRAEAALREGVRIAPEEPGLLASFAHFLVTTGRAAEATEVARRLFALDGDNLTAINLLAVDAMNSNEHARALALYDRALELAPNRPEYRCNRGRALEALGRLEEAALSYRRGHELGLRLEGWSYPSGVWLVRSVLAWTDALVAAKEQPRALEILEEHARAFPDLPEFAARAAALRD